MTIYQRVWKFSFMNWRSNYLFGFTASSSGFYLYLFRATFAYELVERWV